MNVLITGGAGFIGFHATGALLARDHSVTAVDELNAYYDPALKKARLAEIGAPSGYRFVQADIADPGALAKTAGTGRFDVVLHLAAQAGVRHALKDPAAYTRSNRVGHHNVLEFAHEHSAL